MNWKPTFFKVSFSLIKMAARIMVKRITVRIKKEKLTAGEDLRARVSTRVTPKVLTRPMNKRSK